MTNDKTKLVQRARDIPTSTGSHCTGYSESSPLPYQIEYDCCDAACHSRPRMYQKDGDDVSVTKKISLIWLTQN